jgi:iduronate 2-sulfatase
VEWRSESDPTATVEYELYDYQTDPHETRNLAADHPDTVQQLQKLLATTKSPLVSGDMDLFGSAGR